MKHLVLLVATATFTTVTSAQVQFGVKAGLNLSNTINSPGSPISSYSIKPDFHVGALVSLPLAGKLYLQPEVMYSGEGGKSKFDDGAGNTGTTNLGLGYVNIPILLKYNLASGFFAELGPQAGILVNARQKANII